MKGILPNYPHVIAVVRRVMSEEDAETHPLVPIILSNWETAMDLRCGAVRGSNTATAPLCFGASHPCLVVACIATVLPGTPFRLTNVTLERTGACCRSSWTKGTVPGLSGTKH